MCEFPSWVRKGNKIFFLTDKEADKLNIPYRDASSHTALVNLFGEGEHEEGYPIPKELQSVIESGKMKKILASLGYKKMLFDNNGNLHSKREPALIRGRVKFWFWHGEYHRDSGPAVEWPSGERWFYAHGKLTKEESSCQKRANGQLK